MQRYPDELAILNLIENEATLVDVWYSTLFNSVNGMIRLWLQAKLLLPNRLIPD